MDRIEIPTMGKYARLVYAVQERKWIGTKEDMPDGEVFGYRHTPLKSLVSKEIWMKLTRRVPDPERIDQAVKEGLVKLEEISPAYVERYRTPHIRIFDEADEDE